MKWRDFEDTVARMFDKSEIKGFRKQDIVLEPGVAMVIIEDGKIEDVVTQTRLKDVGGGLKNWLSRKVGVGKDTLFLFVDTRPFELEAKIEGVTRDYIPIKGSVTITMQINVDNATKLLNFMREYLVPKYRKKGILKKRMVFNGFTTEGRSLTKSNISQRLMKELNSRVIPSVVARHTVEEFHDNITLQKEMQTETMIQLRKSLAIWGLSLMDLYATFEETDYLRVKKYSARKNLEADVEDADFTRIIREEERRGELQKTRIKKEEEVKDISHEGRLKRHKREKLTELELEKIEDELDMNTLSRLVEIKEKMKSQKIREFQETELKLKELETKAEVEKAKNNLETYLSAQENTMEHQLRMLEKYSEIAGIGARNRSGIRICQHCGREIENEWQVCAYCGKRLD